MNYEDRIAGHFRELGISATYGQDRGLPLHEEPEEVVLVGLDIFGRPRHLVRAAATAWHAMRDAAKAEGIDLLLISAFRTVDYQRAILDRKVAAGTPIEEILKVNTAPGYSEHHTGRAVRPISVARAWIDRDRADLGAVGFGSQISSFRVR